jgi:hypothetical protein
VSDTHAQIPPDSRMNPSSKHPARLSLGRFTFVGSAGHKIHPNRFQNCHFSQLKQSVDESCRNICLQQGRIVTCLTPATRLAAASSLPVSCREPSLSGRGVYPSP